MSAQYPPVLFCVESQCIRDYCLYFRWDVSDPVAISCDLCGVSQLSSSFFPAGSVPIDLLGMSRLPCPFRVISLGCPSSCDRLAPVLNSSSGSSSSRVVVIAARSSSHSVSYFTWGPQSVSHSVSYFTWVRVWAPREIQYKLTLRTRAAREIRYRSHPD